MGVMGPKSNWIGEARLDSAPLLGARLSVFHADSAPWMAAHRTLEERMEVTESRGDYCKYFKKSYWKGSKKVSSRWRGHSAKLGFEQDGGAGREAEDSQREA